ncbi:MAG: AglZ/HisF2 family acetamidino modification protein [Anaerolineales bacterium]|nr:AglZ/HisF2 family acetamidino modification protein [Anaerolineales bacterium]
MIPCLLLKGRGLVKTVRFKDPTYLGDPINVVRIFNDKEVDELVLLDITATAERRKPQIEYIAEIAGECFMPLGYGGGICDLATIREILSVGVEKVIINSHAAKDPSFVREAAREVGSQSLVVSIDVRKNQRGKAEIFTRGGKKSTGCDPVQFAQKMEALGAGELFLTSIDRDGTMQGYDIELIQGVAHSVRIPVVACGGAASVQDLEAAVKQGGASAAAAGSMFVFQGKHRAVLISYPNPQEIQQAFGFS